jgi:hypothetical protein
VDPDPKQFRALLAILPYSHDARQTVGAKMPTDDFDQESSFARIAYHGSREPSLKTFDVLVSAHSSAIAYESIDFLLDRPPNWTCVRAELVIAISTD